MQSLHPFDKHKDHILKLMLVEFFMKLFIDKKVLS